ncbi:exopolysaccharide biosynthesis polyprenyl glycosylphosphotransferase [Agromyces bracchium]|uniref:Exopolysaccharide biosynthesis polyprenyl glycosylphosphotransferase n=1 Tax=Agromyces bracchium TaxID=88376 RepID=A0A6I3MC67_9MICO|nr:exopolysaccharide biosynthesis polyprenyl glycosylphosphotransferase [Agromyces bracchium]
MTPRVRVTRWQRQYARRLFVTDFLAVFTAVFGSQFLRFGTRVEELDLLHAEVTEFAITYSALSVLLVAGWMVALEFFATRDHKIIGSGSLEYKRIADATFRTFGLLAILAFLTQSLIGRGYLIIAFPAGVALLLLGRWGWRHWLNARRAQGEFTYRALLVGEREKSEHVAQQMGRHNDVGITIIGAVTDHGSVERRLSSAIPVLGGYDDVLDIIAESGADTVIITGSDHVGPKQLRRLGWDLEARSVSLIVAPALTDVAGPRIHARPVAGLPLIHVEYPEFDGRKRATKRIFDIVGSLLLIALSAPIMVAVAFAVKFTSPGSVLYRQERIGLRGTPFEMLKFRSMVSGADDQLKSLLDAQGTSEKPLFKINSDPRITPVGRFIRRYSLDELPQFFNVLRGEMSLVGPRPQVPAEVALYEDWAHRRLFMKPGITGLWQVSGRSDLDWDDAIRLDLYYVENWSMVADVVILWRTVRAVVSPGGQAH